MQPGISLDEMNAEGREVLAQKDAELQALLVAVTEAQQTLADLTSQIDAKSAELASISPSTGSQVDIERSLANLDREHRAALEEMRLKHEQEMTLLRSEFERTLRDADQWASEHARAALDQKRWELEQLKVEAQETKRQLDEAMLVRDHAHEARLIDADHKSRADEVADLEAQLSELAALNREELRDARAKVEECVAAVSLRAQTNAEELARLEDEASARKETYDAHVNALREEYRQARGAVEREIAVVNGRAEGTRRITETLERRHETRLAQVAGDAETLRRTAAAPTAQMEVQRARAREAMREAERLWEECKNMEMETSEIDREIRELRMENEELRREISRFREVV